MFKWQDRRQLCRATDSLDQINLTSDEEVIALVREAEDAAQAYLDTLTASTNSDYVLHVITNLTEARKQSLSDFC